MSTKSTYLHGDDFHFYHDYKDFDYHLEFNGKEVKIPIGFKLALADLCGMKFSVENIHRYCQQEKARVDALCNPKFRFKSCTAPVGRFCSKHQTTHKVVKK